MDFVIMHKDLDTRICDFVKGANNTETFRQFIRNTESEFRLHEQPLEDMDLQNLNDYLDYLDDLWVK